MANSIMTTVQADGEPPLNAVHRLLGSNVRVTMTDGRVASGRFICLDRLGNIMLEDVTEKRRLTYQGEDDANSDDNNNTTKHHYVQQSKDENGTYHWNTERSLTQAVIIGSKVAKVEISRRELEERLGGSETRAERRITRDDLPPNESAE